MNTTAMIVVVAFGLVLVAFTGVTFTSPQVSLRFLMRFASSARAHYAEQVVRLLVGTAIVVASPDMWQPRMFWLFGWAIVISSAALMCMPWRWHHRFGERLRPMVVRYLMVYAVGAFALGALLLYGIVAGSGAIA
jgi:hypothetical protein